jgi:heptosyltransferase-2
LGDVVLTFPVLDFIYSQWPSAEVYYATKIQYQNLIENHPIKPKVIYLEQNTPDAWINHLKRLKETNAQFVLDLHSSFRTKLIRLFLSKKHWAVYPKLHAERQQMVKNKILSPVPHVIIRYLQTFKKWEVPLPKKINYKIPVSKKDSGFVREFLKKKRISPFQLVVGIAPGSRWKTKQWIPERFSELAVRLAEHYAMNIFWFGSQNEIPLIQSIQDKVSSMGITNNGINLAQDLSLSQSVAIAERCDVFISNDSGWMHLAAGRNCKVVAVFGSTVPQLGFYPWGKHSIIETTNLTCRPCHIHGRNHCPLGHFRCMYDISVDYVESAISRVIQKM